MNKMNDALAPYAKALVAFAVAFTGAVATGYVDGVMTAGEWWFAGSAGVAALGAVYGVPNRMRTAKHAMND